MGVILSMIRFIIITTLIIIIIIIIITINNSPETIPININIASDINDFQPSDNNATVTADIYVGGGSIL